MGVTGLWKLIEPCGKPAPLETLENKILAIDISIWLHQVIKGFQDSKGYAVANAHLLGLFHRLCKLLYYRIKPVFVFDGKVPVLKKNTIAKRNSKRNKLINEAERIQALLLQSLAKEIVVQKALGTTAAAELLKISPLKSRAADKDNNIDEIFKLPGISSLKEDILESDLNTSSETTDTDTSFSESKARHYYNQNLQAIDVKSKHFRNLPADIRHEILIDIKETRKQSSWGKLHELPSKSNDFSLFQMKRLLKRRQVQESLEEAEKEMDSTRSFTLNELENIFSEEGIIEPSALPNSKHISSDANTRFLLVRDLKKTLATAEAGNKEPEIKPETSKSALAKANANKKCEENMDEEYDNDIQKAILMSLDESAVYDERDYAYDTKFKFNKEQRRHLKNTTEGLARAYMIEHCGMNDDDVRELLEQSQSLNDYINFSHCINKANNEEEARKINDLNNIPISKTTTSTAGKGKADLFELNSSAEMSKEEISSNTSTAFIANESVKHPRTSIEIIVDPSKIRPERDDDIFSDILFDTAQIKHPTYDKGNYDVFDKQVQEFEGIGLISSTDTESENEAVIDVVCKDSNTENLNGDNSEKKGKFNVKVNVLSLNTENKTSVNAISPHTENKTNDKTINMAEILNDLKKQASEVTKISLNEIKIESAKLIVDDDKNEQDEVESIYELRPKIPQNDKYIANKIEDILKKEEEFENHEPTEIIEIIDDARIDNNLPILNTPSKTRVISQFFKTDYVIKRTPEKALEVPGHVPSAKLPKKMLFGESNNERPEMHGVLEEENVLDVAAKTLKESKTHQELEDMASELAKEAIDLEKQRNRQERMGMTLSEKINSECMELLRLFGVPFIVAPMEAEAQCAFLDSIKLTNGTITDDSDIWLFGGRTVYKNFFAQNKYVMEFTSENIESHYKVDRQKLIQLALLVGSDYTSGVNGIGPVTALEIIANFSKAKEENKKSNQQPETVLETLEKFRTWWTSAKTNVVAESSMRRRLRNKLKNIELVDGFPCPAVVEAYMTPTVDNNQEAFSWGSPDIESIEAFTKNNFGWTKLKTDEVLRPVLKKLNEKKSQSTIKNYFSVKSSFSPKHIAVSKRVQNAISKMSIDSKSSENEPESKTAETKKPRKRKQPVDSEGTSNSKQTIAKKTVKKQSVKNKKLLNSV